MSEAMNEHDREFNHPRTEVVYMYQGEEDKKDTGKYVVEMDKPRPTWWPKQLLSKGAN